MQLLMYFYMLTRPAWAGFKTAEAGSDGLYSLYSLYGLYSLFALYG